MAYININKITDIHDRIDIHIKTQQDELYENVSEITGTAIVSYFEYIQKNKMSIHDTLCYVNNIPKIVSTDHNIINDVYSADHDLPLYSTTYAFDDDTVDKTSIEYQDDNNMNDISKMTISKLLKISNQYCAYMTGYNYKLNQIKYYDWLSKENLDKCVTRLNNLISKDAMYETIVKFKNEILSKNNKILIGSIDCINVANVWEFKCVDELKEEHFLQLAIYAFLLLSSNELKCYEEIKKIDRNLHIGDLLYIKHNYIIKKAILKRITNKNNLIVWLDHKKIKIKITDVIKVKRIEKKYNKLNNEYHKPYKFNLLNILTNERYEINASKESLKNMVNYLIQEKFNDKYELNNNEFNNIINNIKGKYNNQINKVINQPIKSNVNVNVNRNGSYIILDIETDGFNKIIEIAYDIYDKDLNFVKRCDYLINDGTRTVDYYKKISLSEIEKYGMPPKIVLQKLLVDMNNCSYIVGHNVIKFDIVKLKQYFDKFGINCEFPIGLDTMLSTKNLVCAKNIKGNIKMPKLSELYSFLFDQDIDESKAHRASYDVEVTFECFKKLCELNIF